MFPATSTEDAVSGNCCQIRTVINGWLCISILSFFFFFLFETKPFFPFSCLHECVRSFFFFELVIVLVNLLKC